RCTLRCRSSNRSAGAGHPFEAIGVPRSISRLRPLHPPGHPMSSVLESEVIQHEDGRVELRDPGSIASSPLYNGDLAPVPVARRDWTTYNYAALWISMAHCIPTYMLA